MSAMFCHTQYIQAFSAIWGPCTTFRQNYEGLFMFAFRMKLQTLRARNTQRVASKPTVNVRRLNASHFATV
jgi:hypothetical protein